MGCMGGGGGGGGGWTGVCVLGDGGGVGRLNLSGLLLLRGEGLCREEENGRSAGGTAHFQYSVTVTEANKTPTRKTRKQPLPYSGLLAPELVIKT